MIIKYKDQKKKEQATQKNKDKEEQKIDYKAKAIAGKEAALGK